MVAPPQLRARAMSLPYGFRSAAESALSLRFALVGVLALTLLVPLTLVDGIAFERERYYQSVVTDIAQGYAHAQTVSGPLLVIPATDQVLERTKTGSVPRLQSALHVVLPEELNVAATLTHQFRSRGIYEVPVYLAEVRLSGSFGPIDRSSIEAAHHSVHWDQAFLSLGIADPRGIRANSELTIGSRSAVLKPGSGVDGLGNGVHVDHPQLPDPDARFQLTLKLAGTSRFAVTPLGDQTHLKVESTWPHPKFEGSYLPANRTIRASGFSADWTTSALARGVPRSFSTARQEFRFLERVAAMQLFEPITQYTVVDRGIKYGALFIALTYLTVLCFELFTGTRLHLVQYGVIGLALVLFYLVFLSLSEHLPLLPAYVGASAIIAGLLGWYALGITGSRRSGGAFMALQVGLYAALYVLLQLIDYALLTGSTLLVVGLAALMAVTRSLASRSDARKPEGNAEPAPAA
ncbi:MAG: cell envelope integrity protein CreD [Pseudomonadota bacterium]